MKNVIECKEFFHTILISSFNTMQIKLERIEKDFKCSIIKDFSYFGSLKEKNHINKNYTKRILEIYFSMFFLMINVYLSYDDMNDKDSNGELYNDVVAFQKINNLIDCIGKCFGVENEISILKNREYEIEKNYFRRLVILRILEVICLKFQNNLTIKVIDVQKQILNILEEYDIRCIEDEDIKEYIETHENLFNNFNIKSDDLIEHIIENRLSKRNKIQISNEEDEKFYVDYCKHIDVFTEFCQKKELNDEDIKDIYLHCVVFFNKITYEQWNYIYNQKVNMCYNSRKIIDAIWRLVKKYSGQYKIKDIILNLKEWLESYVRNLNGLAQPKQFSLLDVIKNNKFEPLTKELLEDFQKDFPLEFVFDEEE